MQFLDPVLNFALVEVSIGYDADDTSIVLASGDGAKLPAPSTDGAFNLVWWNDTDYKDPTLDPNREIVRVTARTTDTLTVTRAQEGTTGSTKNTADKTYKMALVMTKKTLDDIDSKVLPLAGGTMTGDIQLGETDIKLDAVLSGDEKWSGTVMAGVAGATLAVGDLCYLNADDSRWELVDANLSDGYDKELGICVLAGNDGDTIELLKYGKIRSAAFPAFTVGSPLYISETAGDITHTQPTTADVCIRVIGYAITAEDLFFNPSNDYATHI